VCEFVCEREREALGATLSPGVCVCVCVCVCARERERERQRQTLGAALQLVLCVRVSCVCVYVCARERGSSRNMIAR